MYGKEMHNREIIKSATPPAMAAPFMAALKKY
jgi:hypothetical protein